MLVRCLAAIICLAAASPALAATTQPADRPVAQFAIDHWEEPITIPATWAGKPCYFLLDTGCTNNCIDPAYFPDLKPAPISGKLMTAGGLRKAEIYLPPRLNVGPFSLQETGPVVAVDLADFREMIGRPVVGILGIASLRKFAMQIDFDAHAVRFYDSDDLPHDNWGKPFPLHSDRLHCPAIRVSIADTPIDMEIDTGQTEPISLPSATMDKLIHEAKQPVISRQALTMNGPIELRLIRLKDLDLLDLHYHALICDETRGVPALGMEFLDRHLTTIDFPNNRLYLKPGKQFNHRSDIDMSGMQLRRIDGQLIAKTVTPGSPADQAGIRPGDAIESINNKPAADYTMPQLWDLTTIGDGVQLTITYRHGNADQTAKLTLHRPI